MNNDKTSPRERGAAGAHRALLRTAAVVFMFLGGLWLVFGALWLVTLVQLPAGSRPDGVTPDALLQQIVAGLVAAGVGLLLYKAAPHLMD